VWRIVTSSGAQYGSIYERTSSMYVLVLLERLKLLSIDECVIPLFLFPLLLLSLLLREAFVESERSPMRD
jgi:hypothetical protein